MPNQRLHLTTEALYNIFKLIVMAGEPQSVRQLILQDVDMK